MKKILLPFVTLTICLGGMWFWTCGFTSFTVFSYTLKKAGDFPREMPEYKFVNQDSVVFDVSKSNRYTLLNFVYLNCPNVCHKINNRLEDLYHSSLSQFISNQLSFVTVSFDTKDDNLQKIRLYREYFGTDSTLQGWDFAVPFDKNQAKFNQFLDEMGFWKKRVPGKYTFNHSTYLYLISPQGKILIAIDPGKKTNREIIKTVKSWVEKQKPALSYHSY